MGKSPQIKLIVNYFVTRWNGYKYINLDNSKILEFDNISEITNDIVMQKLLEIHNKPITIKNINQINTEMDR